MCQNLDLWFLPFYCIFMLVFFLLFAIFVFLCFIFLVLLPSPFLFGFFIALSFPPLFPHCFVSVFRLLCVSSLAYLNLLGTKSIGYLIV
jgi:hypothetical protein